MKKTAIAFACTVVIGLGAATSASAELIYLGTTEEVGSGIGGQSTLLSFMATGAGNTDASAAIVREAGADQILFDPTTTQINGGANNQTYSFGELGITDASQFRLVWNLNEPGTAGTVTLNDLRVSFYNSTDTLLHAAVLNDCAGPGDPSDAPPCTFTEVAGGIGGQGQVFGLNAAEIALLNSFADFANIRIGLGTQTFYTSLSGDQGGFETFNVAAVTGGGENETPVPEPTSMILLGSGLLGLAAKARKRL